MSEEYILTRGQTSYIQAEYVVKLYYRNRANTESSEGSDTPEEVLLN